MGVIGDIVGEGRGLRLQRGIGPQLQIEFLIEVGDADGKPAFAIWPGRGPIPLRQRTVVLDDAFEGFPGQVQPVELG